MSAKTLFKAIKKRLQTLRIRAGKAWLDRAPVPSEKPLAPENIGGILFLRQDGKIGDYIVSSFAFREIKKSAPHIRIGVVCTEANRSLFDANPHIDAVHIVQAKSSRSYRETGRSIAGQYDVVIDPTVLVRNRDLVLIRSISAPYNIGFAKENYHIFNRNIADKKQHFSEIYREALQICGFQHIDTRYDLPEQPESAAAVGAFLRQNVLGNYVAVNFFGAANRRRFGEARIREMLDDFAAHFPDTRFVLLTYPDATPLLSRLIEGRGNCFLYADTATVQDSAELIRHAHTVISPDTALIHIAAGLDKNIIGLYQNDPQNFANWHPNSPRAEIVRFEAHIDEITPAMIAAPLARFLKQEAV